MDQGAPPGMLPAIVQLRQATRERHEAIEALLGLDGDIPLARYRRVLCGFAAFLPGWEAAVEVALPTRLRPWFRSRARVPRVQRDLAALGVANHPASGAAVALPSVAAAFGSMYVLEGSSLGGQVIARRMAHSHGLDDSSGAAYFTGSGPRTGELWREFRDMLEEEIGTRPQAREDAQAAACRTFDALLQTFHPLLHEPAAA